MGTWVCKECGRVITAPGSWVGGARDSHKLKHIRDNVKLMSQNDKLRRKGILQRKLIANFRLSKFQCEELVALGMSMEQII